MALSKNQFAMSDFNGEGYELNELEGTFTGTLRCSKWGRKCNIVCFVELDDGRKIICTAFQQPNYYLGLDRYDIGDRLEVTYKKNSRGNNKLIAVQRAE